MMKRWIVLAIPLLFMVESGWCQRELGRYWIKDMAKMPRLAPYESLDYGGFMVYSMYDPVQKVGESDLIYLWRPEFGGYQRRRLTRFDLFMESKWETEFRLEQQEDIFYFFEKEDTAVVLSALLDFRTKSQRVYARFFDPEDGSLLRQDLLATYTGTAEAPLLFTTSADKKVLLFFQLRRTRDRNRVILYTDFIHPNGDLAWRAMKTDEILFRSYTSSLQPLEDGLVIMPDRKDQLLDVGIDGEGYLYLSSFIRPDQLEIRRYSPRTQETKALSWEGFPRPEEMKYLYDTGFPPYHMAPGQLYVPMAERTTRGVTRGTHAFELIHFDFVAGTVQPSHHIKTQSSLLVAIEKSREEINSRRLKVFDSYVVRDLRTLSDGRTWMLTQYFTHDNFRAMASSAPDIYRGQEHEIGELIFFVFDTLGQPEQAIIIPTYQLIRSARDRMTQHAHVHFDEKNGEIRLLMREDSGDDYRGTARIYHRRLDLKTGTVSPRKLVYEADRRLHNTPFAFVEWINRDILSFLSYEGEDERMFAMTVNLAQPLEEEMAQEEAKGNR